MPRYRRVLLKLSGEALAGDHSFGICPGRLEEICREIAPLHQAGVEIGIVCGGGNFFRGVKAGEHGFDRVTTDHMGMLATVMNGMAMVDTFDRLRIPARLLSAIEMRQVTETYTRQRARRHLAKGRVVVFAGGTSNPFFSTDTAAVLRALEVEAGIVAKATRVDGVFDKDPLKHNDASRFESVTYQEVLERGLNVMDAAAIALCRDNRLPLVVFNLGVPGNIMRMAMGEPVGTQVHA